MTNRDATPSNAGDLIFIDPKAGFEIRAISPSERLAIEAMIASSTTGTRSAMMLEALAEDSRSAGFWRVRGTERRTGGRLRVRRDGMANDLALIVVVPRTSENTGSVAPCFRMPCVDRVNDRWRPGHPKTWLGFFKACGFKLFGRRVQPNGEVHFRVGWHAPGAHFKGGTSDALTHKPLDPSSDPLPSPESSS